MSLVLIVGISVAVFASSSLALQGVTASSDDLLNDQVVPFESLRMKGEVKTNPKDPDVYELSFKADFRMRTDLVDAPSALQDGQDGVPDVVIEQSTRYPALTDQIDFVGPVGLPFASQSLVLQVVLSGDCFEVDKKGRMKFRFGEGCAKATLILNGQEFDATDLLLKVDGKIERNKRDPARGSVKFSAAFKSPGYGFQIASLGDGSSTTLRIGDMGGTNRTTKVEFSG